MLSAETLELIAPAEPSRPACQFTRISVVSGGLRKLVTALPVLALDRPNFCSYFLRFSCAFQASYLDWRASARAWAGSPSTPRCSGKTGVYVVLQEIESKKLYSAHLTKSCLIFTTKTSQSSDGLDWHDKQMLTKCDADFP